MIAPLEENVQYRVDHAGEDKFYIHTNLDAVNYRLVETPVANSGKTNWKDVIPHRDDTFLKQVDYFKDYLVIQETKEGLANIRIIKWSDQSAHQMEFDEPAYSAGIEYNPAFETDVLRYSYTSMTTPYSVYDYHMGKKYPCQLSIGKINSKKTGVCQVGYMVMGLMVPPGIRLSTITG